MLGVALVDEAGRLLTIDVLGEKALQERIVDIHLVHRPVPGRNKGEDDVDRGRLDHRGKSAAEVDVGELRDLYFCRKSNLAETMLVPAGCGRRV